MTHENLKGRVAVVTGGGGVLCGDFAKALARQGVKVAVLDLNEAAAQKVADEITAAGGEAIAVGCNVLEPESMEAARKVVNERLGTCDILLNGAGGNNPKGTTTKETLEAVDLVEKDENVKTFFDLDPQGISFVFNLNFLGTLIPTQVFARDMAAKDNTCIVMVTSMNAPIPRRKRRLRTSPNSWRFISPRWASASTALRRAFSRPTRTKRFFGTRTVRPPRARARSLPPRR